MRSNKSRSTAKSAFAIFLTFLLAMTLASPPAQAQKFRVLHTFHGKDGGGPDGVLVLDTAGNIYGTTSAGGSSKGLCGDFFKGCGTVFKLDKNGKQVWQYNFNGAHGISPVAGLLRDGAGNLFGTTELGGAVKTCDIPYGCGTVFELGRTGKQEKVLHKFTGNSDGLTPEALLVSDKAGNLYGTAYVGGANGVGVVFKVSASGKETILYTFTGGSDGCAPYPGVILDSAGNLYGVAAEGGNAFCNSGDGVVFEVDPAGNETVLHTFEGGDGAIPTSTLLFDSKGNLYGTTGYGGSGSGCEHNGCGTVFELSPQSGGTWSERVLYSFCSLQNCADGEYGGELVRDSAGNLYGTTSQGGTYQNCNGDTCGVVFKLDTSGNETVLHSFTGGADGADPNGGMVLDRQGNLYGTTQGGGATCYTSYTCGVVFKITP